MLSIFQKQLSKIEEKNIGNGIQKFLIIIGLPSIIQEILIIIHMHMVHI